jgi:hypothetical protein
MNLQARLRAWASGEAGERLTKVELIRNGAVVRTWNVDDKAQAFDESWMLTENATAWYVARCYGSTADQVAITNAIYFEGSDYRRPEPAKAHVIGIVRDRESGAALDGIVEVMEMDGRKAVAKEKVHFKGGRFEISVPATVRLRVSSPGHVEEMKSIFMDSPQLLDSMLNMTPEGISEWSTYEKIRELLQNTKLEYSLNRR